MKITKLIAGEKISLKAGHYLAVSPISTNIVRIKDDQEDIVWEKDLKDYEKRCKFLNSFNNGEMSFDGRNWK